jgi:transposase
MSWDTVKDIQKRNLQRRFTKPRLRGLKEIAIDEISIGRGHRYLTVVLDLRSGAVVNGRESLTPLGLEYLTPLPRSVASQNAVSATR